MYRVDTIPMRDRSIIDFLDNLSFIEMILYGIILLIVLIPLIPAILMIMMFRFAMTY
jgi:hypothetical protein